MNRPMNLAGRHSHGVTWRGGRGPEQRRARSFSGSAFAVIGLAALGLTAAVAAPTNNPMTDPYSTKAVAQNLGATAWWNAGYTGRGVDVAVIDSGVSPVEGLSQPGKVVNGPDLSFDSQSDNLANLDGYGHGTYMAGLIAGHDTALTAPYATAIATHYRGIAPDARIVNVKVGAADGAVDVSQVIAAIDWVVQHKNDNGMNIRVLNLAYGTYSLQSSSVDPLSYAAEQAWKKGIVVVTSAGNNGDQIDALADPAYNPFVIAVGSTDQMGTPAVSDDTLSSFSAHGPSAGKAVDLAAPGAHLEGLRVTNSYIDVNHPEGVINNRFFRGSGSSQAAAITSGAIALILQKYPTLTPDQVKQFLRSKAYKMARVDGDDQGAGEIQLAPLLSATPTAAQQVFAASTGTGTLEAARGADHLTIDGITLAGEQDIFGAPFNSATMAQQEAAGLSWQGGSWNGRTWSGAAWTGYRWSGYRWSGATWSGRTWSGYRWSGAVWDGRTWSARTWSGDSWSGRTWSGRTWSTGSHT